MQTKKIDQKLLESIKNIDLTKIQNINTTPQIKATKYHLTNNLQMDQIYINNKIKDIIRNNLKYNKNIENNDNLNDILNVEDIIEIIMEIEKNFNINIPDDQLYDWIDKISIWDISNITINMLNQNKNKYLSFDELLKLDNRSILAVDFFEAWTNQIKNTLLANIDIKSENTIWAAYIDQHIFWPSNIKPKDEIENSWIFYDNTYSIEVDRATWLEKSPRQRFAYRKPDDQENQIIKK